MIFLGPSSRGPARSATPARHPAWDLEGVTFLSALEPEGPCDGSHGRFCVECASINRNSTPRPLTSKGR